MLARSTSTQPAKQVVWLHGHVPIPFGVQWLTHLILGAIQLLTVNCGIAQLVG